MSIYDVDYDNVIWYLLPWRWRGTVMFAWLKALVGQVKYIYNSFTNYRISQTYFLAHNSQVCYLEAALNDLFDNALRRIYISDPVYYDPLWLFLADEGPVDAPIWLGLVSEEGSTAYADPAWLYTDAETVDIPVSFIVNVPVSLVFDRSQLNALVDRYRLPGKYYSVVTF